MNSRGDGDHRPELAPEDRGKHWQQLRQGVRVRSVLPLMACFSPWFLLLGIVPAVVSAVFNAIPWPSAATEVSTARLGAGLPAASAACAAVVRTFDGPVADDLGPASGLTRARCRRCTRLSSSP